MIQTGADFKTVCAPSDKRTGRPSVTNIHKISISIAACLLAALSAASAFAAADIAFVRERAEQGGVVSQFALANMYFKERGVEQNLDKAL